jgi:hypothetical protein
MRHNVLLLGARCGTASRVRSAKIKFSREKQAQSQQNQAMALSKCYCLTKLCAIYVSADKIKTFKLEKTFG